MTELLSAVVSGIAYGVPLFLVASGLSLIYGVIGVLNFAHGALFVVGALIVATLVGSDSTSALLFAGSIVIAALVVGAIGFVIEVGVIRRLYAAGHLQMLLATFALLLLIEGLATIVWGTSAYSVQKPVPLTGNADILGATMPSYNVMLVIIGAVVAVGLWLLVGRTRFGRSVRAVAQDATMSQAIGLNSRRVMLLVFGLGSALAAVAGGLIAPNVSVAPSLGQDLVLQSFAVVIIGGLGSIPGSLLAAVLVGVCESLVVSYAPWLTGFSFYILVAVVLIARPQGLLSARTGRTA